MNVSLLNHEWLVIGLALAILLVDLWVPPRSRRNLGYVAVAGLAVVLIYSFAAYGLSPEQTQFAFGDMYAMDRLALAVRASGSEQAAIRIYRALP